jgi:hypothetical protein
VRFAGSIAIVGVGTTAGGATEIIAVAIAVTATVGGIRLLLSEQAL